MASLNLNDRLFTRLQARAHREQVSIEALLSRWLDSAESADQEPLWRAIMAVSPDVILLLSEQGEYQEVLCADESQLILPVAELKGKSIAEVLPPALAERMMQVIAQAHNTNSSVEFEYQLRLQAQYAWFHARITPLDHTSSPQVLWVARNITRYKRTEAALRASANLFRSLIESLPQNVFSKDLQGRFTFSNKQNLRTLGRSLEEVIGKTDFDIHPPELALKYREDDRHVMETRQLFEVVEEHEPLGGKRIYVHVIKAPVFDEDGEVSGIIGIYWDVTAQKLAEQQRVQFALEKERVRMLADFLRNASHEFRTPLSVIYMNASLLEHASNPDQRHQHVQHILEQTDSILKLVDSLVRIARLDGVIEFSFDAVNLHELLEVLCTRLEHAIRHQHLELRYTPATPIPQVWGDAELLAQAFYSLLDNAVRFTPAGGLVAIDLVAHPDEIEVAISDTGIGISEAALPHIFEHFYRVDSSHQTRGFGLGLPIAQKIIAGHGGHIKVESQVGAGSTFRVFLPLTPPVS